MPTPAKLFSVLLGLVILLGGTSFSGAAHPGANSVGALPQARQNVAPPSPAASANFSASAAAPSAAFLRWTAIPVTCFSDWVVSYMGPSSWVTLARIANASADSWLVTDLLPNATYQWQLTAESCSGGTVLGSASTDQPGIGPFTGILWSPTSLQLNWAAPGPVGAPLQFDRFDVLASKNLSAYAVLFSASSPTVLGTNLTLSPGTGYSLLLKTVVSDPSGRSATWFAGPLEVDPLQASYGIALDPASPQVVAPGVPFQLECNENGFPLSMFYNWTFGDGTTGTGEVVSHAWTTAGTYSVRCAESRTYGGIEYTDSRSVNVTVAPVVVTLHVPAAGAAPGSSVPVSAVDAWTNNSPSVTSWSSVPAASVATVGLQATWVFPAAGRYTVSLQVTDALGDTGFGSYTFTVAPLGGVVTENPTRAEVGDAVQFTVAGSGGSTTGYTYQWSFGDGTSSSAAAPSHTFRTPGSYAVSVNLTDSLGATATVLGPAFSVAAALIVTVNLTTPAIVVSTNTTLTASVSGGFGPYLCSWDFGDGSTGANCTAVHEWATSGSFNVSVLVTDGTGRSQTVHSLVTVETASSPTSAASTATLSPLLLGGVAAAGILGVALAWLAVRRRRGKNSSVPAPSDEGPA